MNNIVNEILLGYTVLTSYHNSANTDRNSANVLYVGKLVKVTSL